MSRRLAVRSLLGVALSVTMLVGAPVVGAGAHRDDRSTTNLLANPRFAIALPKDWTRDASRDFADGYFLYVPGEHSARLGITIASGDPNDVRWLQTLPIDPNRTYVLSGWIRTKDVAHTTAELDRGANLSPLNWGTGSGIIDIATPPLFGTNGWTYREVAFESQGHTAVTIALRLGYFSGSTTGTAWFRDVSLRARA